jgi:CHU_C Type IX secretion signal domain
MKLILTLIFSCLSFFIFAQTIDSCALTIPKTRTICKGSSTVLCKDKPLPNVDYTWTPSAGVANVKDLNTSFLPTANGIFQLKVKAASCQKTYTATLEVANMGINLVNADTLNFCKSQPTTTVLAVSKLIGIGTISWERNGKELDSLKNFGTLKVTPTTDTKYITYFKNDECVVKDSVQFRIFEDAKDLKILNLPTDICAGQTVTALVSPYDTKSNYQWTLTPNISFSQKKDSLIFMPTANTTVKVAVKNPACQGEFSANLVFKGITKIDVTASKSVICSGDSLTLTANINPTTKLKWSGSFVSLDNLNTKVRVSPTTTTTYTVEGSDSGGCQGKGAVTVEVKKNTTIVVTASKSTICNGDSLTLTANIKPKQKLKWSAKSFVSLDSLSVSIRVSPTTTTTYTVEESVDESCSGKGSVAVAVKEMPTIQQPKKTNFCIGEEAGNIVLNLQPDNNIKYTWQSLNDPNFITSNDPAPKAKPFKNAKYEVIMDKDGCKAADSVVIKILRGDIKITSEKQVCQSSPLTLQFETSFPDQNIKSVLWITGGSNTAINVKPKNGINVYQLNLKYVLDNVTCDYIDSVVVTTKPLPQGYIAINGDSSKVIKLFEGSPINVNFVNTNNIKVLNWDWTKNERSFNDAKDQVFFRDAPFENTIYSVSIKGENGCINTIISPLVEIVQPQKPVFPAVFIPGTKEANDAVFQKLPATDGSERILVLEKITIFNRWGNVVYESDAKSSIWNGQLQNDGDVQAADLYFYKANFKNTLTLKPYITAGEVLLLR